jgi:hypothetical protein
MFVTFEANFNEAIVNVLIGSNYADFTQGRFLHCHSRNILFSVQTNLLHILLIFSTINFVLIAPSPKI